MKVEFKTGKNKIECDSPKPKKQVVPSHGRQSKKYNKDDRPDSSKGLPFNDLQWYTKYPALFEDAATVGFNHIKGTTYYHGLAESSLRASIVEDANDVSVLVGEYITSPGIITDASAGFEMQIRRLYLAMKRKYRGLNTYQVPDLGVTLFCIAEFYRFIARLERIYGIMNYYNATNRIMPVSIPNALRFDYQDVMNNMANFRTGINALIARAHSLCLPSGMDVVNRWFLLESNIFKDSANERAGYIIFDDSDLFYSYQASFSSDGGAAVLTDISNNVNDNYHWTTRELLDAGSDLLGLLLDDDDVTLQLGDIISYFTAENGTTDLLTLNPLPVDYIVTPIYNADILLQIHNSTTIGRKFVTRTTSTLDNTQWSGGNLGCLVVAGQGPTGLWQYQNHLYYDMTLGNSNYTNNTVYFNQSATSARDDLAFRPGNLVLDTWVDKPSAGDVMEMTRLTTAISVQPLVISSAYYHTVRVVACGTEMIMKWYMLDKTTPTLASALQTFTVLPAISLTLENILCAVSKFDWHPIFYGCSVFDTTTSMGSSWAFATIPYGDLDNAKVFTADVLLRIHDAAIMSLFDISSVRAILPQG